MANYRITELDFDDIKDNLKQFLKNYRDKDNNLVFTDYDFEASSLSILLDVLAYNTHYNAYHASMVANELFLDSAVKRESVVSIAKHLGYTPRSVKSARAIVSFSISNPLGSPATLTLPRFTPFTTFIDSKNYTFVNLDNITISRDESGYNFNNITIVEGEPLSYTYRVDLSGPSEKYSIPNKNVDITTLRVRVQNSYTDTTSFTYTQATSLDNLTPDSKIYFLEENPSGFYEIYFGDGTLGKKLDSGNLVSIEYLVSSGSVCNVSSEILQQFTLGSQIGGVNLSSSIFAIQNSTGGSDADNIEEIRFKAPKFFSSFDRAVTASDYKSIIEMSYPLVESIAVWGGEDNDPPMYGKIMISLKPYDGYIVSEDVKRSILQTLSDKKVLSITPEIIDPSYLYAVLNISISHNQKTSKYTSEEIRNLANLIVVNYFKTDLQKFNKSFIYSKLSRLIDSIDSEIIGNNISYKLQKRIIPIVGENSGFSGYSAIKFSNRLISGTIHSTNFFYRVEGEYKTVYMTDVLTENDTSSIILIDYFTNKTVETIGTVNYQTGIISIPVLNIAGFLENSLDIRIYGETDTKDIKTTRDTILVIDDSTLNTQLRRDAGLNIQVTPQ